MNYFLDVFSFTPEDIAQNTAVILWPKKIKAIFDEHDDVRAFSFFMVYYGLLDFPLYLSCLLSRLNISTHIM